MVEPSRSPTRRSSGSAGSSIRPFVPAALLLKGTALLAGGEPDEAERALLDGRSEAERLGFRPILWRIEMELSGIAAATW